MLRGRRRLTSFGRRRWATFAAAWRGRLLDCDNVTVNNRYITVRTSGPHPDITANAPVHQFGAQT
ncbi:MAG: hypothetical protein BJ554DRAFT_2917 [Olpidium bornovanus]|uniref:Uncharacterized protein n=1 Tax=Olpidium bornovanus TaxID=278681 RepID=A0A8H8A0S3_9FUNG|nr:MAG: hypothetical protein BJ554DRAFT_2917 [Olpidium bornovanus]